MADVQPDLSVRGPIVMDSADSLHGLKISNPLWGLEDSMCRRWGAELKDTEELLLLTSLPLLPDQEGSYQEVAYLHTMLNGFKESRFPSEQAKTFQIPQAIVRSRTH